jgi:maltose-6'-phosphate glucosidase
MVRLSEFPLAEIRLYDIDEARQNTIAPVVEKVIRDHSNHQIYRHQPTRKWPSAAHISSSPRCASASIKCASRMRIPLRHGVVGGQETCGRAGWRTVTHYPADG